MPIFLSLVNPSCFLPLVNSTVLAVVILPHEQLQTHKGFPSYYKSNCRWATMFEQQRNRSNNRWLEFGGQKLILKDWADILDTHSSNILSQLNRGKPFQDVYKFYLDKKRRYV